MNENLINNKNIFIKVRDFFYKNLKIVIISLCAFFLFFISFQLFDYYKIYKIKKSSISFFNSQDLKNINEIPAPILDLSNQKNFYSVLSKLELIEINIANENYDSAITLYNALIKNKNINKIYKSAIFSKASYQLIDASFKNNSLDFTTIIDGFINQINEDIISYKGIKLELNYLLKILEVELKNIDYNSFKSATDLHEVIIKSDFTSSAIKERVNKIHEFHQYK